MVLAAVAFLYFYLSQGRVDVYVSDPPAPNLAIYLTFTSVALHRVGNNSGWVVIFNGSKTIALTHTPQLLVSASAPAGEYNEVFFTVSSATIEIGGVNITARIPSGVFKVHITGGMRLSGGSAEKLLISFPHVAYANGQIIISPSITAQVIS
ncbi:hypothetical protein TUZN_0681 [Thermoproteus uzoniensis 768-20]|uniref:DUF4382 domain-containing protein n=1 Tax=Thermoproteus uzoniensis (strain 768-20) TaxID=999630 RepID=F2L4J5_THEU7|nr:hypothetical protein TUZN_0681 [Thermoproteus uzoniensis 768-20]